MKNLLFGFIAFFMLSISAQGEIAQCWISQNPLGDPTTHMTLTGISANATYWLNATGLTPDAVTKFMVKLPKGSLQRKVIRHQAPPLSSTYTPINIPSEYVVKGSAMFIASDGESKCSFPFTVGDEPFESSDTKWIPDGGDDYAASRLDVITNVAAITKIVVNVSLDHAKDDDLVITLISPTGKSVVLSSKQGASGSNFGDSTHARTSFDDDASLTLGDWFAPFAGTFRPDALLSGLEGDNPSGQWTLKVVDLNPNGKFGYIKGWSLIIQ